MDLKALKDDIVASLDIQKFYESWMKGEHIVLDRGGWAKRVRCPFHEDNSTPNFFISLESGSYKCHACSAGGSIFDFWLFMNGRDKSEFMVAIEALAAVGKIDIKRWKEDRDHTSEISAERRKAAQKARPEVNKENTEDEFDKGKPPVSRDLVNKFHKELTAEVVSYLCKSRGFTRKTIDTYLIGWDESWYRKDKDGNAARGRITIPVRAENGSVRNIRGYSNQCDPAYKMVNFIENRGTVNELSRGKPPRLYNLDRMIDENWNHIVICEGEFDAIILTQNLHDAGYTDWGAITPTHGVGNFQPWWLDHFESKNVYLCFDVDAAGKIGASKTATEHFLPGIQAGRFNSVKIVELPGLSGSKEENDITDFFMTKGFTAADFIKAVDNTPPLISGGVDNDEAVEKPIVVEALNIALQSRQYIDRKIVVPLSIVGQTTKRYHAIRQCEVKYCPNMRSDDNECCTNTSQIHTIPYGHKTYISACMNNERSVEMDIGELICKHGRGNKLRIEPVQKVVVELFYAHQVIDRAKTVRRDDGRVENEQDLLPSSVYIMQPPEGRSIRPTNYMATGWVRTHPKTGLACLFVESMEPIEDNWAKFDSSLPENIEHMKSLQKVGRDDLIEAIVNNVTRIYESDEILYAVLLTYLCPQRFIFNSEVQRGWLNVAIVGDTGTGKSATFKKFSDWINVGSSFSALSGSRTGLLYAIKQGSGGEWQLSVGQYVMCDGQILAMDEVQELDPGEIKKMAIAMDEGHLKVERVVTGSFPTRTRAIFIMNPKNAAGRAATVSDFPHGCESICNCLDHMFVRRLDFAVFTTGNRPPEFFNRKIDDNIDEGLDNMPVSAEAFRSLVFWAWTRSVDQVSFTSEATDKCLEFATKLANKYGYAEHVPLANPQDLRLKIARISAAFATLSCSFTDDYQGLMILEEHVCLSAQFLDVVYSSTTCELGDASQRNRSVHILDDYEWMLESFDEALKADSTSSSVPGAGENNFMHLLFTLDREESIRRNDLQRKIGVTNSWLRAKLSMLTGLNMIIDAKFGVKKTRKWFLFMKKWKVDQPERYNKMVNLHTKDALSSARVKGPSNADAQYEYGGGDGYTDYTRREEPSVEEIVSQESLSEEPHW